MARDHDPDSAAGACRMLPSVYQVARELKKERNGLYNCICSVLDDAVFVEELRSLYPGVPVLANLRCGLWYTQQPDDTCYFKSTDGHMGNWSFSTVRLNLHVLQHCVRAGAVMIVDATRNAYKGGFPDALTKTIPIWAAVINRALAQIQQQQYAGSNGQAASQQCTCQPPNPTFCNGQATHGSNCSQPTCNHAVSDGMGSWDTAVHLPPWISSNEVKQVEARVDGWVSQLLATNLPQLEAMAQALSKPLRPLWISQHSRIWVDQVAQPHELPFTPIYLLTASQPIMHQRRPCPLRTSSCIEQTQSSLALQHSAPGPGQTCPDSGMTKQDEEGGKQVWTYLYVPGAGDDEESWAAGLTPTLLWQHQQALIEAGPAGIHHLVQQLVTAAASKPCRQTTTHHDNADDALYKQRGLPGPVATDEHHLSPLGIRDRNSTEVHVQHVGGGAYAVHGTSILLGNRAAGAPPDVWQWADAVLYCGQAPFSDMQKLMAGVLEQLPCQPQEQAMLQEHCQAHEQQQHSVDGQQGAATGPTGTCSGHVDYEFAVAAAHDLDLPVPPPPPHCTTCDVVWSHPSSMVAHFPERASMGRAEQQVGLPSWGRPAERQGSATAFGAPDVQAEAAEQPTPIHPMQRTDCCSGMAGLELLSVASLNATGIPAADKCACQPEASTVGSDISSIPSLASSVQVTRRTSSSGGSASICSMRQHVSNTGSGPAVTPAFEFMPSCVVDLAPADYISVPLQLDSRERAELRAALREHQEAVDAAAAAACMACSCRQQQLQHHTCRRTSLLTSALHTCQHPGSHSNGHGAQQEPHVLAPAGPQQLQDETAQHHFDLTSDPAVAHWTTRRQQTSRLQQGSPFAEASDTLLLQPGSCSSGSSDSMLLNEPDATGFLNTASIWKLTTEPVVQPQQEEQVTQASSEAAPSSAVTDKACYLWLPVAGAKQRTAGATHALQQQLEPALSFVLHHMRRGRRVLIHDDDGLDQCVCVAVAVLLALQRQESKDVVPISKADVRHALAQLATSYPQARPMRGLLKQVFAYFHEQDISHAADTFV